MKRFAAMTQATLMLVLTTTLSAQWTQWGGPNRDFNVASGPLVTEWPESGPKELWSHEFGEGFSSILFEDGRLYTMRRDGEDNVIVSLDAASGRVLWETKYHSPTVEGMVIDYVLGPIATPLLVGDRLYTVGHMAKLHCVNKNSGEILWSRDLYQEMGINLRNSRGFAPSPIAYKNTVILPTGVKDRSVVAFDQETGQVVWESQSFGRATSSPILVNVDGSDQLIVAMGGERAGLNPENGALYWHLSLGRDAGTVMTTQHWGSDNLLFASSAYADGSRVIQVKKVNDTFEAKEVWFSRKMRIMYASYVRIGDTIYGASGGFGPVFLMAINVKTGKIAWRKRGFPRAHFLHADDKVIILDEDGRLTLATATPEDLTIHAQASVLTRTSWTPPTLVGTTLYLRDRKVIKALDLGMTH